MGVFGQNEILVRFRTASAPLAPQWQQDNHLKALESKFPANSMVTSNLPVLIVLIDGRVQASSSDSQISVIKGYQLELHVKIYKFGFASSKANVPT